MKSNLGFNRQNPVKLSALIFLLCCATQAISNDGWVGHAGTPRIEGKHPTIRMVDEVIVIKIGAETMTADCRFTFKNEGAATTARIGFPDVSSNAESWEKARSIYRSFASYVDGKRVQTKFMTEANPENWQVKSVRFAKGQTRKIRNVYTLSLGILSLSGPGAQAPRTRQANYVLATGRSWKGLIGKSTVIFEFDKSSLARLPLRTAEWSSEEKFGNSAFWSKNRNLILWKGPVAPKVTGRKLTFVRTNWEPTEDDDIDLNFGLYYRDY